MANTLIRDGFHVKVTKSQKASMRFLSKMTSGIIDEYRGKTLQQKTDKLMVFEDFYQHSRPDKPMSIRETFCNMLICQKGLSAGMAWAITSNYPTIKSLKLAYNNCASEKDRESLLVGIPYDGGKKVPLSVSKTLHHLFNDSELN